MAERWRVGFPMLREPWTDTECLVFVMRPIPDARGPAFAPSQCYVIGMNRRGQHYKFTAPLEAYRRAELAPVHLLQADGVAAPTGALVDPAGRVLSPEPEERPAIGG